MQTLIEPTRTELREVFSALHAGSVIQVERYPLYRINNWARYYGVKCRVRKEGEGFRVECLERFAPPPSERLRKQTQKSLRERMDRIEVDGGLGLERDEWEAALRAIRLFDAQGVKRFTMQKVGTGDFDVIRLPDANNL